MQFIFGFVPECGLGQRPLHALVHIGARELLKQAHAESDVVIDRHRERRRLLEDHANLGAQQGDILAVGENILAIQQNFTLGALLWIEGVHFVKGTQQGGFTAA